MWKPDDTSQILMRPSSAPVTILVESGEYDNVVIVSRCDDCLRILDSDACSQTSKWPVFEEPNANHSPVLLVETAEMGEEAKERL